MGINKALTVVEMADIDRELLEMDRRGEYWNTTVKRLRDSHTQLELEVKRLRVSYEQAMAHIGKLEDRQ